MSDFISLGIIGGSGLYSMDGLTILEERAVSTPFGDPSENYVIGELEGKKVVFLPRHGKGHTILPSEINYRANIYGFKLLGVNKLISVSAVGSLKEEIAPTDIVIPNQFFDRTSKRPISFFGNGIVAHVSLAHPVCNHTASVIRETAEKINIPVHAGGTYINMEGPAFSTKAESEVFRSFGFSVIGMTNMSEARLAREAEICYTTLAVVTDYDCWHSGHDNVTVDMVIGYLTQGMAKVKTLLKQVISDIDADVACSCNSALQYAIITDKKLIPVKTKETLKPIISKYV